MMLIRFKMFGLLALLALTACKSNTLSYSNNAEVKNEPADNSAYPVMAVPLQASTGQEIEIAKLNQLLLRTDISDEIRARAFYQRGKSYERLGLRDLARIDFGQSLRINPAQPDIFYHLGVYFTQFGEYDAAYEAFDSTLDLDPENQNALHNRAIALYYGGRANLALEDIKEHYKNNSDDPYSALWLYIIESETDEAAAIERLSYYYQNLSKGWGKTLAGIALGEISEKEAIKQVMSGTQNNAAMAQQLTEAYFYLGKRKKAEGRYSDAVSLYKLAISFNVYDYVEHGYSFLELERIYSEYKAANKSGNKDKFVNLHSL